MEITKLSNKNTVQTLNRKNIKAKEGRTNIWIFWKWNAKIPKPSSTLWIMAIYLKIRQINCNPIKNLEASTLELSKWILTHIPLEHGLSCTTWELEWGFIGSAKPNDKRQLGSKSSSQNWAIHLLDFEEWHHAKGMIYVAAGRYNNVIAMKTKTAQWTTLNVYYNIFFKVPWPLNWCGTKGIYKTGL